MQEYLLFASVPPLTTTTLPILLASPKNAMLDADRHKRIYHPTLINATDATEDTEQRTLGCSSLPPHRLLNK